MVTTAEHEQAQPTQVVTATEHAYDETHETAAAYANKNGAEMADLGEYGAEGFVFAYDDGVMVGVVDLENDEMYLGVRGTLPEEVSELMGDAVEDPAVTEAVAQYMEAGVPKDSKQTMADVDHTPRYNGPSVQGVWEEGDDPTEEEQCPKSDEVGMTMADVPHKHRDFDAPM